MGDFAPIRQVVSRIRSRAEERQEHRQERRQAVCLVSHSSPAMPSVPEKISGGKVPSSSEKSNPVQFTDEQLLAKLNLSGNQTISDNKELGLEALDAKDGSIKLHFTCGSPEVSLQYVTDEGGLSSRYRHVVASDTSTGKADCADRFHIQVKRLPGGKIDYQIQLDVPLQGARVSIAGREYFISRKNLEKEFAEREEDAASKIAPHQKGDAAEQTVFVAMEPTSASVETVPTESLEKSKDAPAETPVKSDRAALPEHTPPVAPQGPVEKPELPKDTKQETGPLEEIAQGIEQPKESLIPSLQLPVGDYHVPSAGLREKVAVSGLMGVADKILPAEVLEKIRKENVGEYLVSGSEKVRDLFRSTLSAVNEAAAKQASLQPASDALRKKLGFPEGTQVLLATKGGGILGLSEEWLSEPLDKAFGDTIRIRGFQGPLANPDDVVVLQATQMENAPICLSMSVIQGGSPKRESWSVTTHEATYRNRPFAHVVYSVDRNPGEKRESLAAWSETRAHWFQSPGKKGESTLIETALAKKEQLLVEKQKAAEEEKRQEAIRLEEAKKQSESFVAVNSRHHRLGFKGYVISELFSQNASMRAAESRTGTFRVEPEAGIQLEVTNPKGEKKNLEINSAAQVSKATGEEAEVLRRAMITPFADDKKYSVQRVLNLFPADTYRPNSFSGVFYSPRYYRRELHEALMPLYEGMKTPEQQLKFLGALYGTLEKEGSVTQASLPKIVESMKQVR